MKNKPLSQSQLDQISAFLDGELSASQTDQVAARLENDPAWAAAAGQFQKLGTLLEVWEAPPLRRDLTDSILAKARRKSRLPEWVRAMIPLAAAAAIFLTVAAYHFLTTDSAGVNSLVTLGGQGASDSDTQASEKLLKGIDDQDHFVVKNLDLFQDYDVLADFETLSAIDKPAGLSPSKNAPVSHDVTVERQLQLKRKLLMGNPTLASLLRRNVQSWGNLTPEQRQVYRQRAYAFRDANPQQQQAIMSAWDSFLRLDGEQKQQYRSRAQWLKVVLASLPEEKKESLRQMPAGERAGELLRLKSQMQAQGKLGPDEGTEKPAVSASPTTRPAK